MTQLSRAAPGHIATLDVLRFVAALSVVLFHYLFRGAAADGFLTQGFDGAAPYALYGYLGVNLFFLVSGFVIAWSAQGRAWQDFAVARFARLYPGFVLCMTITFGVLTLAANPHLPVSLAQFVANLAVFSPALGQPFVDGVYWSIVLEIIFYGWVTIALLLGVFDRWKLELVAGWLAVCALNELMIGSGSMRMLFVTEFGPLFAAGILFHHLHSRGRSVETLMLLGAAFLLSCCTMSVTREWMLGHYGVAVPFANLLAANLAIHAVFAAATTYGHRIHATAFLAALGGLTYPLYLLHQNIGYVAIEGLTPQFGKWPAVVVTILFALIVSWAVWRFVETPARLAVKPRADRLMTALIAMARRIRARASPQPAK